GRQNVGGAKSPKALPLPPRRPSRRAARALARRRDDTPGKLMPPRPTQYLDRRGTALLPVPVPRDRRRTADRRRRKYAIPFPDRRLTRSAYEQVFPKLVYG